MDELFSGNAGTLVAASLETAGQIFQSRFLDIILENAGFSVGGFLFLISGLVAFTMLALGGSYKFWTWFLVGPGLFWFTVYHRVETTGTDWQFGARSHDFTDYLDELFHHEGLLEYLDEGENPRVSWVFSAWNHLTSDVVGFIVERLPVQAMEGDYKLLRQSQRYSALYNLTIDNNELSSLLSNTIFSSRCTDYFSLAFSKYLEPKPYSEDEYNERMEAMEEAVVFTWDDPTILPVRNRLLMAALGPFGSIASILSIITSYITDVGTIGSSDDFFDTLLALLQALGLDDDLTLTCPTLWRLTAGMTVDYARLRVDNLIFSTLAQGAAYDDDDDEDDNDEEENAELVLKLLARKFASDGCDLDGDECLGTPLNSLYRLVALRMLHSHLTTINPFQLQRGLSQVDLSPFPFETYSGIGDDLRYQAVEDEYNAKGEFLALLWGLPHLQGVFLFFLGLSFPFFAFAFLIPGRHWAMGTWMSLWFWVKSWDIGFAMVMIVDQILYFLLPIGPVIGTGEAVSSFTFDWDTDPFYDPSEAFYLVFRDDPNVSMAMYYVIVGGLLAAVPVISGFVVKRGAKQLVSIADTRLRDFSTRTGTAWGQANRDAIREARNNYSQNSESSTSSNNSLPYSNGSSLGAVGAAISHGQNAAAPPGAYGQFGDRSNPDLRGINGAAEARQGDSATSLQGTERNRDNPSGNRQPPLAPPPGGNRFPRENPEQAQSVSTENNRRLGSQPADPWTGPGRNPDRYNS